MAVAARRADIVQVMPRIQPPGRPVDAAEFTAATYATKIEHIKAVAGERFQDIELGTQLLLATIGAQPSSLAPIIEKVAGA